MAAIGWLRRRGVEVAWFAFAAANLVAMALVPSWETIPFHFIWISLTLLYGFRVWEPRPTGIVLGLVILATGSLILSDAFSGEQLWGELFEVPLMAAMFLAMVWHARRRQEAVRTLETEVGQRAALMAQQKRFLHDVSHELRTPVTIARGHLEVLQRTNGESAQEVGVALDELERIEHILERLLLLANSKQPDFVVLGDVEVESFLEDVFMRWSVVPRSWTLGSSRGEPSTPIPMPCGTRWTRVENAVKYTEPADAITLAPARGTGSRSRSRTRAPGCRPTGSSGCSTASPAPTPPVPAPRAERGSGLRSSMRSCGPTGEAARRPTGGRRGLHPPLPGLRGGAGSG